MKTKPISDRVKTGNIPLWGFSPAIFFLCFILSSCSKKDDMMPQASNVEMTSKALICNKVFSVYPSGNYNDDSHNIQAALDAAVAAGPGCTVRLSRGTFFLKDRIEVTGFNGFFKGAGKDLTILTTHDKLNFDLPSHQTAALIKFRLGNISMSGMTISVTDPDPCIKVLDDGLGTALPAVIMITGNDLNPGSDGQYAKFNFDNLKFTGGNGNLWDFYNYNIFSFITAFWESDNSITYPLLGGYKITNCEFRQAWHCIGTGYTGGPCIIGGDPKSGNKFEETEVGSTIQDVMSSFALISCNRFEKVHWLGVQPWQGCYVDPALLPLTKFIISNNEIGLNAYEPDQFGWTIGINPVDYGIFSGASTEPKIEALISNNKITINDNGVAGILGECCTKALVTNNNISGIGYAGIALGLFPILDGSIYEPDNQYLIKGNAFDGLVASEAPVWLGPGSSKCFIYADNNDVLDEGTDNLIIGPNNKRFGHTPFEIMEGIRIRHEKMQKFMHRDKR